MWRLMSRFTPSIRSQSVFVSMRRVSTALETGVDEGDPLAGFPARCRGVPVRRCGSAAGDPNCGENRGPRSGVPATETEAGSCDVTSNRLAQKSFCAWLRTSDNATPGSAQSSGLRLQRSRKPAGAVVGAPRGMVDGPAKTAAAGPSQAAATTAALSRREGADLHVLRIASSIPELSGPSCRRRLNPLLTKTVHD